MHRFNGNEGYDDAFLADFNRYLLDKYPAYGPADWEILFHMDRDNTLHRDLPVDDLAGNFNYGRYLQKNGWASDPKNRGYGGEDCSANPLAKEWGDLRYPAPVRLGGGDFINTAMGFYWKLLVLKIRAYGRNVHNKELIVAGDGILPWTDLNEYGLWSGNRDDDGAEAPWLPLDGRRDLDGSRSLMGAFRSLARQSRLFAGKAPLVVYLGMDPVQAGSYNGLSVDQKQDFWRIYVPEAYACGLFCAFHLRVCYNNQPTSKDAGILPFFFRTMPASTSPTGICIRGWKIAAAAF